ncbi:MAG: hypothetical protein KBA60_10560 [Flavobacteriales bacterium]|nr:hypothetical protein [Flavobacteriales bacterium]
MKARWTGFSILIIGVLLVVSSSNINWGKEHWKTVLQADAKGYYAYLPALFIYHDPNFGFFDAIERERYYDPNLFYDYRANHHGDLINKYYLGTALAQLPFFGVAHAYTIATEGPADGYSKSYSVAVNLAAITWVLIGLVCMGSFLRTYSIAPLWIAVTLVGFTFGTNLFYYAVIAPGMSHAYSFGLCSAFLLVGRKLLQKQEHKGILFLGLLLGIIVLIRPVNGIILFALPILADGELHWRTFPPLVKTHLPAIVGAAVLCVSVVSLQLVYYQIATGSPFVYSYGDEGFRWTDPHMLDILFSYRKGLFVYTPLLLFSLVGWPYLWRLSKTAAWAWSAFFILLTYVLSSWWNWWYGGSFGARPYVEYLGLFMLLFALALDRLMKSWRSVLLITAMLVVVLCQVQTYQMRYYQIHWENMDKAKYWEVFLRVDKLP